jgi:hypothetical protein
MNETTTNNGSRASLWLKLYVLMMTCLAGSIIFLILYIFGIRGLSTAHYACMVFVAIVAAMTWTIWPSKAK